MRSGSVPSTRRLARRRRHDPLRNHGPNAPSARQFDSQVFPRITVVFGVKRARQARLRARLVRLKWSASGCGVVAAASCSEAGRHRRRSALAVADQRPPSMRSKASSDPARSPAASTGDLRHRLAPIPRLHDLVPIALESPDQGVSMLRLVLDKQHRAENRARLSSRRHRALDSAARARALTASEGREPARRGPHGPSARSSAG